MTFYDCAFYAAMGEDPNCSDWKMWRQKDGSVIDVGQMSTSHILNSLKMVQRSNPDSVWVDIFQRELVDREDQQGHY